MHLPRLLRLRRLRVQLRQQRGNMMSANPPILICALCRPDDREAGHGEGAVRGVCIRCRSGIWVRSRGCIQSADLWCEKCGRRETAAVKP